MSTVGVTTDLARRLRDLCGERSVVEDPALLGDAGAGWMVPWSPPAIGVLPRSPDEIAAVLQLATTYSIGVVPAGGFTYQSPRLQPKQ